MRRWGMTLPELTGVLGSVCIAVVAFLYPVTTTRRDGCARNTSCNSNIRQITMAMQMYALDEGGQLPLRRKWANAIFPYLKSTNAYQCPQDTTVDETDILVTGSAVYFIDYWYNANLSETKLFASSRSYSNILPSFTLLIGEGNDGLDSNDDSYIKGTLNSEWLTDNSKPSFRHKGGANYGFADGHVKWLKPSEITTGPSTVAKAIFRPR